MPAAAVMAAATVAGAAISSNASKKAADSQVAAADRATDLQRDIFNKQVDLQAPFRQSGLLANNRLLYLLGLSPTGVGDANGMTGSAPETRDEIRARLLPQYTNTGAGSNVLTQLYNSENEGAGANIGYRQGSMPGGPSVDEAGLSAAIQNEIEKQNSASAAADQNALTKALSDPEYGSLMRDFSTQDFQQDPGYNFRLDEGLKALNRKNAALGMMGSGRAMKDVTRFAQGLASDEYSNAFNRFQVNRSNKLNPLQSLAGVGQTATNALSQAAQGYGSSAGELITGAGNAAAAGTIGAANGLTRAMTNGWNMYQGNRNSDLLDNYVKNLGGRGGSSGGGYADESWRTTGNGYDF